MQYAAELASQCVTDGVVIDLECPAEGFNADDYDYITWLPEGLVDYEDYSTTGTLTAVLSAGREYETHEITCDYQPDQFYHAIIIITGEM